MRKFLLPALALAALLLATACAACSKAAPPRPGRRVELPATWECRAQLRLGTLAVEGELQRSATGEIAIGLQRPQSMAGLTLRLAEGELSSGYQGLSFAVAEEVPPTTAPLLLVHNLLNELCGLSFRPPQEREGDCLLTFESQYGAAKAVLAGEGFLPKRIEVDSIGFQAVFA